MLDEARSEHPLTSPMSGAAPADQNDHAEPAEVPAAGDQDAAAAAAGAAAAPGPLSPALPAPLSSLPGCELISEREDGSRVWACASFCGRPCVIKQCSEQQSCRHAKLDRKQRGSSRLKQEVRGLCRMRRLGVPAPAPYHADPAAGLVYMQRVPGSLLSEVLSSGKSISLDDQAVASVLREVGRVLAVMHDGGLVHGNLRTANFLVRHPDRAVVPLGFGLSFSSILAEDKGLDLWLLEQDAAAAHSGLPGTFDRVLKSYKQHSKQWSATFNRLANVRNQSRKKAATGGGK